MTLSTFRIRWSGGTNASTSTITMSFRESFFQFSIFLPPFLHYNRRTPPVERFFDRLRQLLTTSVRSCFVKEVLLSSEPGTMGDW